jgi:hypothetical protein
MFSFSMVKGEGAISMMIKPLDAALTDNDHIYAVVCLFQVLDRFCTSNVTLFRSSGQLSILMEPELHYMHRVQLHNNSAF